MKQLRMVAFAALMLATAACRPMSLYMVEPSGPPDYKLGWEDGCDSGLAAQGGMVAKAAYGFKKRPEYFDNTLYTSAWNEGFTYCRFSLDPVDKSQWFN